MHLIIINGQPEKYSIKQLRRDNPNISFPKALTDELLASYSIYPYTRPDHPYYDPLIAKVVDGNFEQDSDGKWVLPYIIEQAPLKDAERNVRSNRDSLLQETDWIVVKSYERNENISAEWTTYRQALRDISTQAGFPYSIVWPDKPN